MTLSIDDETYRLIKDICDERRYRRIFPYHALNTEIKQASVYPVEDVVAALRRLRAAGKIEIYRTINHTAVSIIDENT